MMCKETKEQLIFIQALVKDIAEAIQLNNYCYLIQATQHSYTSGLYEVSQEGCKYRNETVDIFKAFMSRIKLWKDKGILLIRVENKKTPVFKMISHYNPELFANDIFELILFQEYGIEPCEESRKQVLKTSIKKERIKESLVYACYENNTESILERVRKVAPSQLDKKLEYTGTPLGLCAQNNNLVGFKALAEAGASLNKKSLAETPLEIAFAYSPDIVKYIYHNHKEQFDKEVSKKGFSIAIHTRDIDLLQLFLDHDCDMNCSGKSFPPLHNFVDYHNIVGLKFLIEKGADINTKNQHKQTPLDRAKRQGNEEVINILKAYGATD